MGYVARLFGNKMRTKMLLEYLFGRPQDTVCKYNNKMDPTLIECDGVDSISFPERKEK